MPNGGTAPPNISGPSAFGPNNGQVIQSGAKRILCVADVRGMS